MKVRQIRNNENKNKIKLITKKIKIKNYNTIFNFVPTPFHPLSINPSLTGPQPRTGSVS